MNQTLLLVEDIPAERKAYAKLLQDEGYEVVPTGSIADACRELDRKDFAVAIIDMQIPPSAHATIDTKGGLRVVEYARTKNPLIRCIVLTVDDTFETAVESMRSGACDYVAKRVKTVVPELLMRVGNAFRFYVSQTHYDSLLAHYTYELGCPIQPSTHKCNRTEEIRKDFDRRNFFVSIPFANYLDERTAIKTILETAGLRPVIVDEIPESGALLCNICKSIRCSGYGIADISRLDRLNIIYELGLMHVLSKKVLILFNSEEDTKQPPSDLLGVKWEAYNQKKSKILTLKLAVAEWLIKNVPEAYRAELEHERDGVRVALSKE
jgi:CheY-like chemotaxis protein